MATRRTGWLASGALAVLVLVLVLQKTKQALLPRTETPTLRLALGVSAAAALLLSGWGRDSGWRAEQESLGTLANNFYEPRRDWLISGFAIGLGVFGALWWGLATWSVMFYGMRRGVAGHGLLDFETAAACGLVTGALVGAAVGLIVGHVWETSHRKARRARASHA